MKELLIVVLSFGIVASSIVGTNVTKITTIKYDRIIC